MGLRRWTKHETAYLEDNGWTTYERDLYADQVESEYHEYFNNKTTIVVLRLKSGFEVTGVSSCEHKHNFKVDLGHAYAVKDALKKLGELVTYYRAQRHYEDQERSKQLIKKDH